MGELTLNFEPAMILKILNELKSNPSSSEDICIIPYIMHIFIFTITVYFTLTVTRFQVIRLFRNHDFRSDGRWASIKMQFLTRVIGTRFSSRARSVLLP